MVNKCPFVKSLFLDMTFQLGWRVWAFLLGQVEAMIFKS